MMAVISCCVASPLPSCSSVSSPALQIFHCSARIRIATSFYKKNNRGIVYCSLTSQVVVASSRPPARIGRAGRNGDMEFCVVTFYKFVSIENPEGEVVKHQEFLQGRDIHGRIYVNEQGINAQYSGPIEDALAYADWLKEDPKFSDILVQTSPALDGHAFPRLKMRYKPSLVQFEGGMSHLPVLNPTMRAILLTPAEWRERLQASINSLELPNKANGSNHDRRTLLLDVRNGYEWDVGHFQGAERPEVDSFRHTSVGLASEETLAFDLLAGVDKENTDILMYCTGGIRCDVYSTVLSGGISHYLKNEGSTGWVGNLFVFDSRLSLPPSTYNSSLIENVRSKIVSESERFAKCFICRSQVVEFRHRNCANLDCNLLFLSCGSCVEEFRGCCCYGCTHARRLRPVLPGHKRYEKWHRYRDDDF